MMTYERVRQMGYFMLHLVIKHCLNRYLRDEIIQAVVRRKELSLSPKDLHSLHIMVAFSLLAANRSTQATGQLHTSNELSKRATTLSCLYSL